MADEVAKRLRERLATMTTHEWLVRVSELSQAVESRDRVIAEQRRTIERLQELLDGLRAQVGRPKSGTTEPTKHPPRVRARRGGSAGDQIPKRRDLRLNGYPDE